jgi:hypothetical protein
MKMRISKENNLNRQIFASYPEATQQMGSQITIELYNDLWLEITLPIRERLGELLIHTWLNSQKEDLLYEN